MTDAEKVKRLRAELLHDKSCWYGAQRCSHPEERAKRDIARLLDEPFRSKALEAEEAWLNTPTRHYDSQGYCDNPGRGY